MRLQILIYLLLNFASCSQVNHANVIWKSDYRALSFPVNEPWQRLPTLDTEEQTLSGVIDLSNGTSYTIKITNDVSKAKLSDSQYYEGVKKIMLNANKANKLLQETDTIFHSLSAHRIDYIMQTDRWGLMKQVNYIIRDGKQFISVQILFPVKEDESEKEIPDSVEIFDKTVLLNEK